MMRWSNPLVSAVATPPVAAAQGWIRGRSFPEEKPLLDLAQAVPSYLPAEALRRRVAEAANEPETSLYSDILGAAALRARFARHLSGEYAARVEAGNVAITSGCNQAYCVAVCALAGPGDEVILPVPYYFNHDMWLRMQGIVPVYLPFDPRHPGRLRLDALREALTPRTRALVLVSPANPTGAEYPSADIEAAHEMLRGRGASLVIDETYKDFRAGSGPPHMLMASGAHQDAGLVQLFSFSKAYSMAGYRVGAIACNAGLLAEIEKLLDCVAICPARISQAAALFALEHLNEWREAKSRLMRERVGLLREHFARSNLGYQLVSCGAYFAYVRHPFGGTASLEVARRLADRQNILCLPGSFFGPGQDDYLRFAFANVESDCFEALIDRLRASQSEG